VGRRIPGESKQKESGYSRGGLERRKQEAGSFDEKWERREGPQLERPWGVDVWTLRKKGLMLRQGETLEEG